MACQCSRAGELQRREGSERRVCCAAILLLKGAQQWCAEHSRQLPQGSKEKAAFKQMLKSWQRTIDGIPAGVSSPAFPCQ